MDDLRYVVECVVKCLVDKPEAVKVVESKGQQTVLINIRVDKSDFGKILGRQGININSIRTLIKAASIRMGQRYHINVIEDEV